MNFVKFKITTVSLLLLSTALLAQVKNIGVPDIQNYKRTEYKGATQNWDIDQDKNGNLYFANNSGLLQFDGSSWTKYLLPNSTSVRSVKVDNADRIYVGGYKEFGYFQADSKGKLKYTSLSKLLKSTNNQELDFLWKIHITKDEVIFQSFTKIYIFKDNKIKIIQAPKRFQFSFQINNKVYIQDKSLGILEYKNEKLYPLKGTTSLNNIEVWAMFKMPDNKILIATLEKGLFIYSNEKLTSWDTEANAFIRKNSSLGGVTIKDKFIVLNSVLNGIIISDLNGKIIQHIDRKKGLQNNTVLTSYIDNKNNLWLGLDNGIAFINESSPFTYFGFSYDISTVYASIIYDGYLYVATNQGVFYHAWNTAFKEDAFSLVEGTNTQTWNIQVINNELICANNRGALIIKGNKAIKILDKNGYFGFKTIPNHPNYIIGSNYNGFALFEKTTTGIEFRNQITGFSNSSNLFELDNNYLWLKKDEFLYQMELSEDLKRFKSIKKIHNLPGEKGMGSIQKINKSLYFQTNNHFYKYSKEQEAFFKDKKMTQVFKDIPTISSLFEDSNGNLWYVFNESLGELVKSSDGSYKNVVAPFSNLTGNLVTNYLSVNTIDPENIFIGLTNGLAHYDSQLINNTVTKPTVFIRTFTYANDTLTFGNQTKVQEKYSVPYASNHVRFTFSSPTYESLENVEYSYQLEPFDENWSNWSTISVKEYTNLIEGHYNMKVKVRNSYGIQSEVDMIPFIISPPWYRHPLAYIIYFILILMGIYSTSYRIKMKIRKNKYYETIEQRRLYLEKESKIRQEQYQLEKEIEKLKNDKLQIKILTKDKELVNNSLQVVKKNKILNGIIHKLKEIDSETFDESTKFQFTKLNKSITKEVNTDKSWKDLEKHIKNVHFEFLKRLKEKYPKISPRELDLATYLLMNMSTKEIAEIMNISNGGVELARYRLRKKLELNKKENLIGFLMSI
ncbi:LuxR C-terminal-related transcriptional regulator [Flavobacterium sp. F-65]|uniref:LuxR C-terminal-related transcriptional regulator n=1 Tax=Flavobacterium pisciphilum TaxID=2893755 RepID=A0ABS8MVU4_9FLAO|nr:triple tyrosine motif-containing protein [Flavobacterium sp. F-65]MCC9072877.1 LuxR C-terminal-related transcriptional regulator [Flavobacterium sp. F-65]